MYNLKRKMTLRKLGKEKDKVNQNNDINCMDLV